MSTAAVSSSSISQQLQQYFQTRTTDLRQLGQALQSGDLSAAQTAFSNVATLGKSGPVANGNPFYSSQREQDFTAIGQALQSGDLAGAQKALEALRSTVGKGTGVGQNPPIANPISPVANPVSGVGPEVIINLSSGGASPASPSGAAAPTFTTAASNGPEIILNLANNSGSTSPEQITIDISNAASGSGEQVSIGVGNQGANTPQLTFNLPANSNEQIVLNLLDGSSATSNASSSTASSSSAAGGLSVSA
jgi:hypothetical protein